MSYNFEDRKVVVWLVEGLLKRGFAVDWGGDLRAADDWTQRFDDLVAADAVVVVWSRSSASTPEVLREAAQAQTAGMLVPVSIGDMAAVPDSFRSLQTVDLSRWNGDGNDAQFDQLVRSIAARFGSPELQPMNGDIPRPRANAALEVRPAAYEVLLLASAVAVARGVPAPTELDVFLACLARIEVSSLDQIELAGGATASLYRAIPKPADERITAALAAVNVDRSQLLLSSAYTATDPRLLGVMAAAQRIAASVGASELWSHHIAAAALIGDPLPEQILSLLEIDNARLRAALRSAIDQRWPKESNQEWNRILGPLTDYGIPPILRDRLFIVDTLGSQGVRGLAVLVDHVTALTVFVVASSLPFLLLEGVGTGVTTQARVIPGSNRERIALLELLETEHLQTEPLQLYPTIPELNSPLEIIGFEPAKGPVLLRGDAGEPTESGFTVRLAEPVAPEIILAGAPVVRAGRVIGVVEALSAARLSVVPASELLRLLRSRASSESAEFLPASIDSANSTEIDSDVRDADTPDADADQPGVESSHDTPQGSPQVLDGEVLGLLAAARQVRGDQPRPIESLDVVLGGLGAASGGAIAAELVAMWAVIPTVPSRRERLQAALRAWGSSVTLQPTTGSDTIGIQGDVGASTDPYGEPLIIAAGQLLSRLGNSGTIEVRHLLAIALVGRAGIPTEVETALGVDLAVLRSAVLEAVRTTAAGSGESSTDWAELLAAGEPTLTSSIDSDLVVWDEKRPLTDQLDIETYVNMLSLVIAAQATPLPLSIGLFGPWGSGKTYFMGLMRQAIMKLADQAVVDREGGREPLFCARIVSITFNAWHYADANLWASLAVRIFDELSGREKKERDDLDKLRQGLIEKLRVYTNLQSELKEEQDRAETKAVELAKRLNEARMKWESAVASAASLRATDIVKAAWKDPRLQQLWARTSSELKGLDISPDFDQLAETAANLKSSYNQAVTLRSAFKDRGRVRVLAVLIPVLAIAGVVLLMVPGVLQSVGGASIVAALAAAGRVTTWLQGRAAEIGQVMYHIEATIAVADDARVRAQARNLVEVEQAEREADRAASELVELEQRRDAAAAAVDDINGQLDDLRAGVRLERFIAERSTSSDYQRQLGVVSMARRDFEDLTSALRDAIDEYRQGTGEPPIVDRIVLYIDDLDRCSANRVVEVLEAVHLMLAMDLFVVVVGVDPRWLLQSLRRRFRGLLDRAPKGARDGEFFQWTPQNYLEKIFQIPFVLPAMSRDGYRALINSLLTATELSGTRLPTPSVADNAEVVGHAPSTLPDASGGAVTVSSASFAPLASDAPPTSIDQTSITSEEGSLSDAMKMHRATIDMPANGEPSATFTISPRLLDLTKSEVELLAGLAPLVRTPRVAKRMLNIYRMLRVTRALGPASTFLVEDYQAVCQLLSLSTGYPKVFGLLLWAGPFDGEVRGGLLERPKNDRWSDFVDHLSPQQGKKGRWTNAVSKTIRPDEVDEWNAAVAALVGVRPSLTLPDSLEIYQRWAPWIARFSFELAPLTSAGPSAVAQKIVEFGDVSAVASGQSPERSGAGAAGLAG